MELIADILLIAGAIGAAFYCIVLSRRLSRFTDLENGVGGAIAVLSAQVDDMTKALDKAQESARGSTETLSKLTDRAEDMARRLELLLASMHDLPDEGRAPDARAPVTPSPAEAQARFGVARHRSDDAAPAVPPAEAFRSSRSWIREAAE